MTQPTQAQIEANLEQWDEWYKTLPPALKAKLSISDFRRLGDNFYRIFVLQKAAAQVGEPPDDDLYFSTDQAQWHLDQIKWAQDSTIERCAQVAEEWLKENGYDLTDLGLLAAIRRLKDAP